MFYTLLDEIIKYQIDGIKIHKLVVSRTVYDRLVYEAEPLVDGCKESKETKLFGVIIEPSDNLKGFEVRAYREETRLIEVTKTNKGI